MGAQSGYGLPWRPKYLLLLAIGAVAIIGVDQLLPGAGLAIAGSIALFWAIDTGAIFYLGRKLGELRKAVTE